MLQHNPTAAFPDTGYPHSHHHPSLSALINMATYSSSDLSPLVHTNGAGHAPIPNHHPAGEIFVPSSHQQAQGHQAIQQPAQTQQQQHHHQPQRHHSVGAVNLAGVYAAGQTGCYPGNNNGLATGSLPANIKDSRWLTLEVCRQFQRNQCTRSDSECKFAHPPPHVDVQNGRVTCCYDSIKGKCQRREPPCKYLHPPQHLREQLMVNGRNSMILRNMQLQLLHQQLLAQRGAAAAAAVAAVNMATGTSQAPPNPHNSIIYPGAVPLSLTSSTAASGYPVLNFGYSPYLNALTTGHEYLAPQPPPSHLPSEHVTATTTTLNGYSSLCNGTSLLVGAPGRVGKRLPQPSTNTNGNSAAPSGNNATRSNKTSTGSPIPANMPVDSDGVGEAAPVALVTGSSCVYVMNGGAATAMDSSKSSNPGDLPPQGHNALFAIQPGLSATSATHHQAGYFQPAYHMEIPSFAYQ